MSAVDFVHGFVVEIDLVRGETRIDGRAVVAEEVARVYKSPAPPSVKLSEISKYCQRLIERSSGFKEREKVQRKQLSILKKGVQRWNKWRLDNPTIRPLLYDCKLTEGDLRTTLDGADFANALLVNSDLSSQHLRGANFHEANLARATLNGADLSRAHFCRTDFYNTKMVGATLNDANLQATLLAKTDLTRAKLIGCRLYGIAAWDLTLDGAEQKDLIVRYTDPVSGDDRQITVDSLEVAQLIYFLLNNKNIPTFLNTLERKTVLILGRFVPEKRKAVLNAIRDELRRLGYVPMIFDFDRPDNRNFTETVTTLAGLSRFIVADITNPKSAPLELKATVQAYTVPIAPILDDSDKENPFSMLADLQQQGSVLGVLHYDSADQLVKAIEKGVVNLALKRANELAPRKRKVIPERFAKNYQ